MNVFAWYNLVFEVPFGVALAILVLQAFGLLDFGEDDADAHVGDHGSTHAVDADDGNHDSEAENESAWGRAMDLLGFGRVPLTICLMTWCFLFGFFGWLGNQVFDQWGTPAITFWISFPLALVGAFVGTGFLVRLLAKYLPGTETFRIRSVDELSGLVAETAYAVTETGGWARVRDSFGNLHEVQVRLSPDQEAVPANTRIVLLEYDQNDKTFLFDTAANFFQAMGGNLSRN